MTQTKSSRSAGPRKLSGSSDRRKRLARGGGGGASPGGNSTRTPVLLTSPAPSRSGGLERLLRRRFELLGDAIDVVRVLREVLQQREERVAAEGARHQVRHVEAEDLRVSELSRRLLRQRVRVDLGVDVLVRRGEAALLGPDLGGLGGGQVLDQRPRGRVVLEHD